MTTRELIAASLRKLGVIAATEDADAADETAALSALNAWLDGQNAVALALYEIARNVHNLAADTASYTIGDGATWDQDRPLTIESASIILDPSEDDPVEVALGRPLTREEYQGIPIKTTTSTYPTRYYYNHGTDASGFGTVKVYPVPDTSTPDFVIYNKALLTEVTQANITNTLYLPPGYRRMLIHNLALEIAPEFEKEPSADVRRIAAESMADVRKANYRPSELRFRRVFGGPRRFNVYTGN